MFFDGIADIFRVIFVGFFAYLSLILLLRVSGKRTLSKMNAFDFVVTVALGSILANIMLSKETSFIEGIVALGMLIFLQFIISSLSVRSKAVKDIIRGEPSLLFHRGEFLEKTMSRERITKDEIIQSIREHGIGEVEDVQAVVMETNGSISVIGKSSTEQATVLSGMKGV